MDENSLFKYWQKNVKSKCLYRVISEEYAQDTLKNGFDHRKDPFRKNKKEIFKLFDICLKLHERGFIMMRWWGKPVDQVGVIGTCKIDLNTDFIDFTPDFNNILDYYAKLKGGAMVATILIFTEELLMKKPPLTNSETKLITKLNVWAKKKASYKSKVLSIPASSKYFEKAIFQTFVNEYVDSPFGSFEHFKEVISKKGIEFYDPYLSGKKLFYIRTSRPIPASEIKK